MTKRRVDPFPWREPRCGSGDAASDAHQVVAAVIERDGRFLVTRRQAGVHLAGHVGVPGRQDRTTARRTPRRSSARFARSSTPTSTLASLVFDTAHAYPDRTVALHFYRCALRERRGRCSDRRCAWVPRAELATLGFPPADEELITRMTDLRVADRGRPPRPDGMLDLDQPCLARRNRDARSPARSIRAAETRRRSSRSRPRDRPRRSSRHAPERTVDAQADQLAGHATVTAMQHADDDFLPDVAALGHRDRPILDAGFERDRVVGHVHAEDRIAASMRAASIASARQLRTRRRSSARVSASRCPRARRTRSSRHAQLIDARDDRTSASRIVVRTC